MRGIRGIGKNRMNIHSIRKATQGLANYILKETGEDGTKRGVAIAYDCRLDSEENAINTALVLAGNGIKLIYLKNWNNSRAFVCSKISKSSSRCYDHCSSHNPKEYNGYKVYWKMELK